MNNTPWLKVDFHLHSYEDPQDELDHSAMELLERAKALGYGALAITLHGHVLSKPEVFDYARELGLLLIPAAEMRLEGADVVVLNISEEDALGLHTFADLANLRARRGESIFVFAPHPYYVFGGSMGDSLLIEHMALFDAIEISHFYTHWVDPNRRAREIAHRFKKPLLATSDAHMLDYFGEHFTLVNSESEPTAIFNAIRCGSMRAVSPPWPLWRFLHHAWWILVNHQIRMTLARVNGTV